MNLRKIAAPVIGFEGKLEKEFKRQRLIRFINNKIEKDKAELPELTASQIDEIRAYWGKFGFSDVPLQWHRFYYGKTGQIRPDFIPATLFYQTIKPAMNDVAFGAVWSDKAYLDYFLRGIPTVDCVLRNVSGRWLDADFRLVGRAQAEEILSHYDRLVVKPAIDTNTGKGVVLLDKPFSLEKILQSHRRDFVIQTPLKQHPVMAKLNESSVNTIRINSVLFEDKASVMSAFIKVGQTGQFADNSGHDRFFIGIREDGTFADYAVNHDFKIFTAIPSGFQFAGESVPSFEKACRTAELAHQQLAHFGFVFFDVCINENGEPVIVEANLKNPDSMLPQVCSGPFFGKYTEKVMDYISAGKNRG